MPTERTLVVPAEGPWSVLWRPLVSAPAVAAAALAVVVVVLAVENEVDAYPWGWALLLGGPVVLVALGGLQALWWRYKLGDVRYEADPASLRVLRGHAVIHEWRWGDIHKLKLEGDVDWHTLVVFKAGVDDFPRLLIHTSDGVTTAPGVLLWGRENTEKAQRHLADMHRAHSR